MNYDLVIRGGTVIDGTGAPPRGPVNVLVSDNRITQVGGLPARPDRVLDARGMYLLPGFVDMHGHCGGKPKAPEAEYVYKLWMAHGITTVRGVPLARPVGETSLAVATGGAVPCEALGGAVAEWNAAQAQLASAFADAVLGGLPGLAGLAQVAEEACAGGLASLRAREVPRLHRTQSPKLEQASSSRSPSVIV